MHWFPLGGSAVSSRNTAVDARSVEPITEAAVFTISQTISAIFRFAYIKLLHKNSVQKKKKKQRSSISFIHYKLINIMRIFYRLFMLGPETGSRKDDPQIHSAQGSDIITATLK